MNRTYNLVFNKALGLVQVVSELASCRGKKSTGKPSVSQAHPSHIQNSSVPFKLKAISIASALTVGSFLIMVSPSSFAQPIDNTSGNIPTLSPTGTITGGVGGNGASGFYGDNGQPGGLGINNYAGTIGTLNNNATINGGVGGVGGAGYYGGTGGTGGAGVNNSYGTITTLDNTGSITGGAGGAGGQALGLVAAGYGGIGGAAINNTDGTIATLNNGGSITGGIGGISGSSYYSGTGGSGGAGIQNGNGTLTTLNNNGSITGGGGGAGIFTYYAGRGGGSGGAGIQNCNGALTTLNNNGSITGGAVGFTPAGQLNFGDFVGFAGVGIDNSAGGTITTLNNNGSITGGSDNGSTASGIKNLGSIETLNNAQGGDQLTPAKTALTYQGNLPTNYNIIINSPSYYGQITFSSPSGTTTFGISSLSGTNIGVTGTRYENVISGLSSNDITNEATTLTYTNGMQVATYQLVTDDLNVANTWDLFILSMISGPSATDTQSSIHSLARKLRGAFSNQAVSTNFANMNYDCDLFDAKGVCLSVGGQQTYVDNPSSNRTSTVVVAGYKLSPNMRIGGFVNQNINNKPVSGVNISNANPLMGAFAVWNQKEDRLGYQVKVSSAYQDKDVTTTRDVVESSEAGTGKTSLNTQSYMGELSYAFHANNEKTLVRPYAALRYTRIKQDGYTEQTSADVTAPLTYAALADRSTTALVGIKLNHKLAANVNLTGNIGVEQDLHHQVDNLTAAGVPDLISENFNNSIKRTRPVASIGAYYMPVKNQRISADVYYQQMAFQSTGSATAYVNYTIGF